MLVDRASSTRLPGAPDRDRVEALIAAALMASAATMFYYARHLLPYDSSLALALLALWCGVGTRVVIRLPAAPSASAAFITYNGYWLLAAVVLLAPHRLHEGRTAMRSAAQARAPTRAPAFAIVPAVDHARGACDRRAAAVLRECAGSRAR